MPLWEGASSDTPVGTTRYKGFRVEIIEKCMMQSSVHMHALMGHVNTRVHATRSCQLIDVVGNNKNNFTFYIGLNISKGDESYKTRNFPIFVDCKSLFFSRFLIIRTYKLHHSRHIYNLWVPLNKPHNLAEKNVYFLQNPGYNEVSPIQICFLFSFHLEF
jgi:hypothetical protein